jgi:hypothetical protein
MILRRPISRRMPWLGRPTSGEELTANDAASARRIHMHDDMSGYG